MAVLKANFTTGLCGTCYRELPAQIEYRDDGAAYITKTCPVHGFEEAMVERDWKFWDTATQKNPKNKTWQEYNNLSIIEVTERCNVQCKHCYHMPDNSIADKSTEHIIKLAEATYTEKICQPQLPRSQCLEERPERAEQRGAGQNQFWSGELYGREQQASGAGHGPDAVDPLVDTGKPVAIRFLCPQSQ